MRVKKTEMQSVFLVVMMEKKRKTRIRVRGGVGVLYLPV
jgi:hypothetical protein